MTRPLHLTDLAGVVYSAGKVFDGLAAGRLDTEHFLRDGTTDGISSRADLALLDDLRDIAQYLLDHTPPVDAHTVCALNTQISRSGALHPGQLRTDAQQIGVKTRYGRHTPPALTALQLQRLVGDTVTGDDPADDAINLFIALANAQPFEDGNKRTALFAANALLIATESATLLTIPVDDDDPALADTFNGLLARAYVHASRAPLVSHLRDQGLVTLRR